MHANDCFSSDQEIECDFHNKATINDILPNLTSVISGYVGIESFSNIPGLPGGTVSYNGGTYNVTIGTALAIITGCKGFGFMNITLENETRINASFNINSYLTATSTAILIPPSVTLLPVVSGSVTSTSTTLNIDFTGYSTGSVNTFISGIGNIILTTQFYTITSLGILFTSITTIEFTNPPVTTQVGTSLLRVPDSLKAIPLSLPYENIHLGEVDPRAKCQEKILLVEIPKEDILTSFLYSINTIILSVNGFTLLPGIFNFLLSSGNVGIVPTYTSLPFPNCAHLTRVYGVINKKCLTD